MWQTLKRLYREEDGFLNWLIPLLLTGLQLKRQSDAQSEIDQAEESLIPGEEASIRETAIQRGLGGSSYIGSAIAQPRESYNRTKKVRRASQILQATDPSAPLAYGIDALQRRLGSSQGGTPSLNLNENLIFDPSSRSWVPNPFRRGVF